MYSPIVKEHFLHPRNVGDLDHPDRIGEAKNETDGDWVRLSFRIHNNIIEDVRIRVMGCVAAIALTSFLSEYVKGKTIDQALAITKEELAQQVGGLPPQKLHCSMTCLDALHTALNPTKGETHGK